MEDFGFALLGFAGRVIYALCVLAACFGSIHATTFTTPRLIHAAAQDHHLPSIFGELDHKLTPIRALLLHGALSSILLMVGNFSGLLLFDGLMEWGWYFVCSTEESR